MTKRRSFRKTTVKKGKKNVSKNTTTTTVMRANEDIIEKIFSYMDYETLCTVQRVCRFWKKKACERLSTNYPPFSVNLPIFYCTDRNHLLHKQEECIEKNPTIKNLLMTDPEKVAIFFTDGQYPKDLLSLIICTSDNLDNVQDDYLKFLPFESFAVSEFIFVDGNEIRGEENQMTAIFFQKIPSIKIRTSIVTQKRLSKQFDYSDVILEIFDFTDPEDIGESCVIIFGLNHKDCKPRRNAKFIEELLLELSDDPTHEMTVWGGAHVEITHAGIETDSERIQWHILRIVGIKSYSIALSLDLNEDIFKKKLQDLKNKIFLKKEAFALAITHTKDHKSEAKGLIMKKVLWFKDVFNIKLTTILSYIEDYSCDPIIFCNTSDNADLKIDNKNLNTVAYLIISN